MAGPIHPRLLQRARATRTFLVASVAVGVITAVLVIAQAWLIAHGVVGVFETKSLTGLTWMIAALAAVFVGRGVLAWVSSVLAHRAAAAVKSQLRREVMAARLRRPTDHSATSSSLIHVMTSGLDALDGYYAKYLPQVGLAVVVPLLVGAVILVADWQSALIIAITVPLIPVFMALIGWTTQKATARRFRVADRLANHFADLIEGLPTLQAFGRARAQARGVEITEQAHRRETMRALSVSFLSALALELLANLSVAVVAVTIGFRVVFGHVDFTTALFVLILAPEAFLPVRQVGVHFHDSADGVAAADAAFEIIDRAEVPAGGRRVVPSPGDAAVRLDEVGLTHPGSDRPALSALSLVVEPGEVVALSGASGGGKTTALRLLMGFERPDTGRVLVGGVDLADADLAAWHRQVAFVAQNPGMVLGTVGDNVALGIEDATAHEVNAALRAVAADFGADKSVGDDGEGLSAGERRRVALAGALLRLERGASLLVLDEPTAGLDAETEAVVLRAVRASGASALLVTHRPAALAMVDRVVEVSAP